MVGTIETPALRGMHNSVHAACRSFTAGDLRALPATKRQIEAAVASGVLIRVRRGTYMLPGTDPAAIAAAAAGGRLCCVSVLVLLGVFVRRHDTLHLHFPRSAGKLTPTEREAVWHWSPLLRTPHPRSVHVELLDALVQATNCQRPRDAIATLDSALHLGLIDRDDLDDVFAAVSSQRRVLRRFVDGAAESGIETLVRLMALALGFRVEVQVRLRGVGRVDLLLDGWLVVECDSEQWHTGWDSQKRDRRRDLAAAALGLTSIRPVAEDALFHPEIVVNALRGLREAHERR